MLSVDLVGNVLYLLLFALATMAVYYALPGKGKQVFLFIVSTLFYALSDCKMALVLVLTVVWTWFCSHRIQKAHSKGWMAAGVASVAAMLFFFKYHQFFLPSVQTLLGRFGLAGDALTILMPLGVSYYSFKAVSYVVDVYKGKYEAEKNILWYASYLLYFPEIVSGPISRYNDFKGAMNRTVTFSGQNVEEGFYLIIKGLFMKLVIANRLVDYIDRVFEGYIRYTGLALWVAVVFYTIRLYCDFAGYSSIAIGISRLLGLHKVDNFVRPYFAVDIRDFWDRWHISLSSWLKDYIYIPLGGSRCAKWRSKLNVLIVFAVSGLWHGSGLNFLVWGLYHGLLNILTPKRKQQPTGFKKCGLVLLNFCAVAFGWIFFGLPSLGDACRYIGCMFTNLSFTMADIQSVVSPFTGDNTCVAFGLVTMFFVGCLFFREWYEEKRKLSVDTVAKMPWQVFLLSSVMLFGNFGASGFIYANF